MINLTKKAADRFHIKWADLQEQSGDHWKIDMIMVSHYPVLLIVHEYTLYTLVRRKSEFKSIEHIVHEIKIKCPWYQCPDKIIAGKNSDRKLVGSMNEMKMATAGGYSMNFTEEIQERINNNWYSYLSEEKYNYGTPYEALEKYKKGEWPPWV